MLVSFTQYYYYLFVYLWLGLKKEAREVSRVCCLMNALALFISFRCAVPTF